jgi:hypothetical protein
MRLRRACDGTAAQALPHENTAHAYSMHDIRWSPAEKKHARALFEQVLERELAERIAQFKALSASAKTADDMWSIRRHLEHSERELERKYDYRYSQLLFVFGRLLREGRVTVDQLAFLSEEKLDVIDRIASL